MNRDDLEARLRIDACSVSPQCPDTPRQRVMRRLRTGSSGNTRARVGWSLAATVPLAAVVAVVALNIRDAATPELPDADVDPVVLHAPGPDTADRAMAGREDGLRREMARIRADLQRIRGLVNPR